VPEESPMEAAEVAGTPETVMQPSTASMEQSERETVVRARWGCTMDDDNDSSDDGQGGETSDDITATAQVDVDGFHRPTDHLSRQKRSRKRAARKSPASAEPAPRKVSLTDTRPDTAAAATSSSETAPKITTDTAVPLLSSSEISQLCTS